MELEEIKQKKQTGDVSRILTIVNTRRAASGEPIYARSTIKHMLNGTRTLKDDVRRATEDYFNSLNSLSHENATTASN
jgi:hypothetical protein